MNSQWMLGSCIIAILFACAAVVMTRVAALYRVPLRWIWVGASVASLVATLVWLIPRAEGEVPVMSVAPPPGSPSNPGGLAVPARSFSPASAHEPSSLQSALDDLAQQASSAVDAGLFPLPRFPRQIERVLTAVWLAVSSLFGVTLLVAAIRLRADERTWRRETVSGIDVRVSSEFGPAIVGLRAPAIVVPEWVLVIPDREQRAIVIHEAEHLAARDPWLIVAGLLTLVLMPWNPGMWWHWRGLRRTIELDCDARVVAHGVECSEYAHVLLGAWKRARGSWLPATALAERASGLGARVEHLMRPEPRRRAMNTGLGLAATAALVMAACAVPSPRAGTPSPSDPYPLIVVDGVPRPDIPPYGRYTGKVAVETTTTPFAIRYSGRMVADTNATKLYPKEFQLYQELDAPVSEKHLGPRARYGARLYYTKQYIEGGGRIIGASDVRLAEVPVSAATTPEEFAVEGVRSAFRGIAVSDAQRSRAVEIQRGYIASRQAIWAERAPMMITTRRSADVHTRRNADLRGLLSTDADRARFDENVAPFAVTPWPLELASRDVLGRIVQPVNLQADRQAKGMAIVRPSVTDETSLYERDPNATAERAQIVAAREARVLALLTAEERAKVDESRARRNQRP